MINGPHSARMLPKPPACSCMESREALGCIGAGGRGASMEGLVSGGDAADAIPALGTAAAAPDPVVFAAAVPALAPAAADLAVEVLAELVRDAGAAVLPEAGFSRLVVVFAAFFVVAAAEVVFVAVFFCPTIFATFFAAFFAAARVPPRTGPKAPRSGSRAVSFALLSSVIARSPRRCRDATTPNRRPQPPGSTVAPPAWRDSSIIARAKWMPPPRP